MANIFFGGDEVAKKENMDYPIGSILGDSNLKTASQFTQTFGLDRNKIHLKTIRDNIPAYTEKGLLAGNYGNSIVFGGQDTYTVLSANSFINDVRIFSVSDMSQLNYNERIAFKSDIEALKARISALESKIGGVLSSLLNYLFNRLAVA